MQVNSDQYLSKCKEVNLTIRQVVMKAAKALHFNAPKAVEFDIIQAIKKAQADEWPHLSRKGLNTHNECVTKDGVLLKPDWA